MRLTVQYFTGCPNWQQLLNRLRDMTATRSDISIDTQAVETAEEAERLGFTGSPTLLIDGRDPFAEPGRPAGLACRVYITPDGPAGLPSRSQLEKLLA